MSLAVDSSNYQTITDFSISNAHSSYSDSLRIVGGIILTLISITGAFLNTTIVLTLLGPLKNGDGFLKICLVKCCMNVVICYGFLIIPVPCTFMNQYYLPTFFNVLLGQIMGWFGGTLAPLTQILLSGNRLFAVYYPHSFHQKCTPKFTTVCLIGAMIFSTLVSIAGFYDGCHFIFMIDVLGYAPEDSYCARALSAFYVTMAFTLAIISNTFNVVVILKLIADSARIIISNNESLRRRSKRRIMFAQSVCQDILILFDTTNTTLTFQLYDAQWFQFVCLSLSMVMTRMLEGLLMILINKQIRRAACKLLRIEYFNTSVGVNIVSVAPTQLNSK